MTIRGLGKRIKAQREGLKLSQPALAERARLNQSYIAQLELGQRTNPSLEVLDRLAKALACPIEKLLRG